MRIYLTLTPSKEMLPFDHLPNLVGTLHKWLGTNDEHDNVSLYSFSWLQGGVAADKKGLVFPNGARWFISAHDVDWIKKLVRGITQDPKVAFGMHITEVVLKATPVFNQDDYKFDLGSPVLVKRNTENNQKFFFYDDPQSDELLTDTFRTKLKKAQLPTDGASVRFDRAFTKACTKMSTYRNIKNKASLCPVIVEGTSEQIGFAWDVGVGNSTGIGFGSLV